MELQKNPVFLLLFITGFIQTQYYVLAQSQEPLLFLEDNEKEVLGHIFGEMYDENVCKEPKRPENGALYCGKSLTLPDTYVCRAACNARYEFPNKLKKGKLVCDLNTSKWHPRKEFPNCVKEILCDPPCINGGICEEGNFCSCPPRYNGIACEKEKCEKPAPPSSGKILCRNSTLYPNMYFCEVQCNPGFQFSNSQTRESFSCNFETGEWAPKLETRSSTCQRICTPSCQNGGVCIEGNKCVCTSNFRGERCDVESCTNPGAPHNGKISCRKLLSNENRTVCDAECNAGHQFPSGEEKIRHTCDLNTGKWTPKYEFPHCERICTPSCQNGGVCIEGNKCVCTSNFRGERCDVESCTNPGFPQNGKMSCRKLISNENRTVCDAECNAGHQFPSGEEKIRHACDLNTGKWTPKYEFPHCEPIRASSCEDGWTKYFNTDNPKTSELGDDESLDRIRAQNEFCTGGRITDIECKALVRGKMMDYKLFNQFGLKCSVSTGFQCIEHVRGRQCLDFTVRFLCECGEVESPKPPLVTMCPEAPHSLKRNCTVCSEGYSCDGTLATKCVPTDLCPCFKKGIFFEPNSEIITEDCHRCTCFSGGKSVCDPIKCKDCSPGRKAVMDSKCNCPCQGCPDGTVQCPTSGECIAETLWCNGIADCPDDEKDCPKTDNGTDNPFTCSTDNAPDTDVCNLLGNTIQTFDGQSYQYETCNHILMKQSESEDYSVSVHKICPSRNLESCYRQLEINADGTNIKFGPGIDSVTYKNTKVSTDNLWLISQRNSEFEIKKAGNVLIFRSLKHHFDVTWNKAEDIKLVVSRCLIDNIVGLCGLYNTHSKDDFIMPDGQTALGAKEFGNSWTIGSLEKCKPQIYPPETVIVSNKTCSKLNEDPFNSSCSQHVNINDWMGACNKFMLECLQKSDKRRDSTIDKNARSASELNKCKCQAFESFAEACEISKNGPFDEWRIQHDCSPNCPEGMVWKDCGPGCQLTCDNYRQQSKLCGSKCVPGCYCPSGLVRHQDQCVKPRMCHDCVCRGHGDPNYITFDGRYYAFQGNCTYVLAQHNNSEDSASNFKILSTNVECPEEPQTSCIEELSIYWNGHIIKKKKNNAVLIGQKTLKPEDFPFEKAGISITYEPNKSTVVHIHEINLVVRYFDQMYGFTIELPSFFYFNKTEGLCGICNFIESDDLYRRDGYVTADIQDFAYSWLEGPETRKNCEFPRVERPEIPPDLCNFTNNACTDILDPSKYAQSCQNDVKFSLTPNTSMCRSKFQYAQLCCERGVSLADWLEQNGCETSCPSGMEYKCTSGCSKTCENYKTWGRDECNLTPLFSCVCPEEQVLKSGKCVKTTECETCDTKGHVIGEVWQEGPCKTCECLPNLSTSCAVQQCPEPPICDSKDKLQKLPRQEGSCCDLYNCVPKTINRCHEPKLEFCPPGKTNVKYDTGRCPVYRCECFPELCPPTVMTTLDEGENFTIETRDCCPEVKIICNSSHCPPPPTCSPGFKPSSEMGRCCNKFTCIPQKNVCVYQHKYRIKNGFQLALSLEDFYDKEYEPGTSWRDGLCRHCSCTETSGHLGYSCEVETCPNAKSFSDGDKYVWELVPIPGSCCPKFKRTHCRDNGVVYKIGEVWKTSKMSVCQRTCIADQNGEAVFDITIRCEMPCQDIL